jgi:dienelactone hydrolase
MALALTALQRQFAADREKAELDARFMLLDHVEDLLARRQPIPPLSLADPDLTTKTRALSRSVRLSLGLMPLPRRTSLLAWRVGTVRREGYIIEKIIFQPRHGFVVPAHLYLPTNARLPLPGILYASGHFVEDGIMYPASQSCCIALAKMGFAVFAYEAMGQGERGPHWEEFRQKWLPALQQSARLQELWQRIPDEHRRRQWMAWAWHCLLAEHGQLPPLLVGLHQMGFMVWESIRALDYLCSRNDIDATRLGMVGASGGGQNAYYTAALDERVKAVVCICYLPSLSKEIRLSRGTNWWGGGDLCDQIPSHLTYAEFADIGALILPRPLLFVAAQGDEGFPIAATRAEFRRLTTVYEALAPERLRLVEVPGPHGLSEPMREAAYAWFTRWLQGQNEHWKRAEPPLVTEPPTSSEMRCLPDGGGASSRAALLRLSAARADRYARRRERASAANHWACCRSQILERLQQALGPEPSEGTWVEVSRANQSFIRGELLCLRTARRAKALATAVHAMENADRRPLILVVHGGDWDGAWSAGWLELLLERGCDVALLDLPGLGPSKLRTSHPPDRLQALEENLLHEDKHGAAFVTDFEITSAYLMLGRTLLAERVGDLRRFIDWSAEQATTPSAIGCLGIGQGGLVALFAAALDSRIETAATWQSPASLRSLLVPDTTYPPSCFVFGALRSFDLPEVVATIAPRTVALANPCDGRGHPLGADEVTTIYRRSWQTGDMFTVDGNLRILVGAPPEIQARVCDQLVQAASKRPIAAQGR